MRRAAIALLLMVVVAAACSESDAVPQSVPTSEAAGTPQTVTSAPLPAPTEPATTAPPGDSGAGETTTSAAPDTAIPMFSLDDVVLALEPVADGFEQPVFLTAPAGDDRLFVVDQPGRVWVIAGGDPELFLDIRDRVTFGGERGLLGMAFHPAYGSNGRFFVNYTGAGGETVVAEFAASGDPARADSASERVLLEVEQPASNHNGGMIAFGPDGVLWIGMGDGGRANDAFGHGQRPETLLGAMLRIDVDSAEPYAIPSDNPFVAGGGAAEVWGYGLRNPWRFSFDGDLLYVADVGQNLWEEIHVTSAGAAGTNFGWPIMEGTHCFRPDSECDRTGLDLPALDYGHGEGCSVTGGYVYRGAQIPEVAGHYFYSDWCAGWVRSFRIDGGVVADAREWTDQIGEQSAVTSFGVDGRGELYVVSGDGRIGRITRG